MSFALQDNDGTQADFIDSVNVKLRDVDGELEVVSNDRGREANIVPLNERGGDKVLRYRRACDSHFHRHRMRI